MAPPWIDAPVPLPVCPPGSLRSSEFHGVSPPVECVLVQRPLPGRCHAQGVAALSIGDGMRGQIVSSRPKSGRAKASWKAVLIGAVMLVVAGVFASAPWTGHGSVGRVLGDAAAGVPLASSGTRRPAARPVTRLLHRVQTCRLREPSSSTATCRTP